MPIVSTGQLTLTDLNDAKQLVMYIGASQSRTVIFNGVSTYTPNYSTSNQVLTPQLFVAGGNADVGSSATATRWYYQTNGAGAVAAITADTTDYTLGITQPKTLTLKTNLLTANTSMTYICEMDYPDPDTGFTVTTKAEIEIVKVTNGTNGANGSDAIIGVLSNESSTVPADSAGTVSSFSTAVTTLKIYKGSTDDTVNWTISQARSAGLTVTEATTSATATVTAMTQDSSTVTFTATRSGYSTVTKTFTITKNKQGTTGQNATSYWTTTPAVVQMSPTKVYTPTSITVNGYSQVGTGTPSAYAGRFIIAESTDGSTYTDKYTSSANESSKSYVPTAQATSAIKTIRVRFYLAGGTTTLLDEQIIPIVADGTSSIYTNVWTPNGNAIKNSTSTVIAQVDVYDGINTVTPSAFKWYIQDPTATTVSGGDTDSGNGWRLMPNDGTAPTTAPTLNGATAGGTLTGATYYVRYTWVTPSGETITSPEVSLAVTANYNLKVTIPAFAAGVVKAKVYVGTTAGVANLKYQGDINTSAGTLTIAAPINTTNPVAPDGNNPTTAPTLALVTNGGSTLTATTYYVRYTWININGETGSSSEASLAVTAGNNLRVTIPAFASGATSAKVYIGTATGALNLRYQGDITTSGGNLSISAPISTTSVVTPTGYTGVTGVATATITIPASAILGMEAFKCVATYNGTKYSGVTTVVDLSDPIAVRIDGVAIFKNGTGSTTLRATLLQAGTEIDSAGNSGYVYTWSIYDSSNVKSSFAATGKTITVNATDVNGIGNIVCDISKV